MERVHIIGRGAIGIALASQWKDAGCEVVFICDQSRKRKYETESLTVNGSPYQFEYRDTEQLDSVPEVIFLSVKYYHLESVYPILDRIMNGITLLVSLLNGIDSEELLSKRYGRSFVINAFVNRIDATFDGKNLGFTSPGVVVFGDRAGEYPENIEKVRAILEAGGLGYSLEKDILSAQWRKFMVNIGMNQVSALLGATYGRFQENPHARAVARMAMEETIAVAKAEGIYILPGEIDNVFSMIARYSPDGKTSMLQDVEGQRKTEVEMFAGVLCRLGEKHGIPTPVNRVLYHSIKALESKL